MSRKEKELLLVALVHLNCAITQQALVLAQLAYKEACEARDKLVQKK
jgi:hypothetical protein